MGNPFSSLLDVQTLTQSVESGRSFDFSYDDYYKSASESKHIHKEKKGFWGGDKHDDDCD